MKHLTRYIGWIGALGLAWGAFMSPCGLLVFLYPALLARSLKGLGAGQRMLAALAWGFAFSALFYFWAFRYGFWAWLGLVLIRGGPWLLFPFFNLLLERAVKKTEARNSEPKEGGLEFLEAIAQGLGLALVSYLQLSGITGVDWETPAGGLTGYPVLLSVLPGTGLVGAAFLIGLISALGMGRENRSRLVAIGFLAGWLMFGLLGGNEVGRSEFQVALLQTGWSQGQKWDKATRAVAQDRLLEMTTEAAENGAELVVWPETAWPNQGMLRRPRDTRKIGRLARKLGIDIIATSIEVRTVGEQERWLNSACQVLPSGRFGDSFAKLRLAPFGEYIPVSDSWEESLRKSPLFAQISPFIPGQKEVVFETNSGLKFAVLICYESMTPERANRLSGQVDFLVVSTNDAPFSSRIAREAHFRSAILRAAETRVPVLQAANTGVSGWIDSQGGVQSRTNPGLLGPCVQYARSNTM